MGIADLKALADDDKPVTQEDIAAADAEHADNAYADRNTRAEIEQTFAEERESIDARYQEDLVKAEVRRDKAHLKNRDKQAKAYEKSGLNPNGSDPRGREQTVL